jgi:hypothetical protein
MKSAKKQRTEKITTSYLGSEEDNAETLKDKKLLKYSPNVEFFINTYSEYMVAIVRTGEPNQNPVYKVTDLRLIPIIEAYADVVGGTTFYFKVPY